MASEGHRRTIKGKEEDTLSFANDVTMVYGGKDNDTLTFATNKSTISGGLLWR